MHSLTDHRSNIPSPQRTRKRRTVSSRVPIKKSCGIFVPCFVTHACTTSGLTNSYPLWHHSTYCTTVPYIELLICVPAKPTSDVGTSCRLDRARCAPVTVPPCCCSSNHFATSLFTNCWYVLYILHTVHIVHVPCFLMHIYLHFVITCSDLTHTSHLYSHTSIHLVSFTSVN